MEDESGAGADLNSWLGRPPQNPKPVPITEANDEPASERAERGPVDRKCTKAMPEHPRSDSTNHGSCSHSSDIVIIADGGGDSEQAPGTAKTDEMEDSDNESGSSPQGLLQDFYIAIPKLDPTVLDSYENLPGHFVAERIKSEVRPDRFVVKLASGERQILTSRQIRSLENGSKVLEYYRKKVKSRGTSRGYQNSTASGMIDWSNIGISSSDDSPPTLRSRQHGRRRRQPLHHRSDAGVNSEEPSSTSSSEPESSDHGARRSRRITQNKSARYTKDFSPQSDDSSLETRTRSGARNVIKARTSQKLPLRSSRRTEQSRERSTAIARRSERTRVLPRRNMREMQEHEISAASEEEAGPKVVGTKEIFLKLTGGDPFRKRHLQQCGTCQIQGDSHEKGLLVFCQGCTHSYHTKCLGPRGSREHLVTKVGENNFVLQCRRCLGRAQVKDPLAPDQGLCAHCNEPGPLSRPLRERLTARQEQLQREENGGKDPITIVDPALPNNADNVMFRCSTCQRAWHMHHMPERSIAHTQDEFDEGELDEKQIAQRRFDFYRHSWVCKDCAENKEAIDVLVSWRPNDLDKYIPGCTADMVKESDKEYLIKWHKRSYFRTKWMPGSWVFVKAPSAMRAAFLKKESNQMPKMSTKDAIPEDFLRIDIVFDVRYSSIVKNAVKGIDMLRAKEVETAFLKYKGLGYEDAIWETPPTYDDRERFEDYRLAYEDYVTKRYMIMPNKGNLTKHINAVRNQDFQMGVMKKQQPSIIPSELKMMEYQLEGLNWLLYQWHIKRNAILADEMGLGKTIQLIAFFATLIQDHNCWPFLVVVPNSTCPNWRREIKKWAPSLRVVTYYGSAQARKLAKDYELFPRPKEDNPVKNASRSKETKDIKAHVVVTSYEAVNEAKNDLAGVNWQGLIVDEGQRLKNDKGLLYDALTKLQVPFKVLLTGTPLQNNARELFNLLQFLDKSLNAAKLEEKYETLTDENVPELHNIIRPLFLRRTKVQVLTFLPPMAQIILPVTMSTVQKRIYKSILAKDPALMKSILSHGPVAAKERHNLNNILMQLRKTLCHPFVYSRDVEERGLDYTITHRNLVEASSKLQLLQIMLPKLQERGHRVLIFSQFLDNLDIVEDFLDGLGLQHRRLDGSINSMEKQKRIDEFNAPNSPYFAFLLSTRAGGVGINLASADTVIIMDPDFNPHQDIQALSRAHRIGQKQKVLVFQMMTRGSAEEKIMQISKKKMALDHVLIQQMDQEDDAGVNLESILRHGAEALFDDDNTRDITYDSASVDKLLDRSQIESTASGEDKSAESQFSFARVWANDKAALEDGLQESDAATPSANPGIWDKILKERERAYAEEAARKAEAFGRGKRKRQNVDYGTGGNADADLFSSPHKARGDLSASDTDFQAEEAESEVNEAGSNEEAAHPIANDSRVKVPTIKARPWKRAKVPTGVAPYFNGDGPADYINTGALPAARHCPVCGEFHPMGWCRLKLAGVEHCGLCGLAHLGSGRTCPHLNSEAQVATLLGTLKESTEPQELIEQATKYLRMIRGDLVQRKRNAERKAQEAAARAQSKTQLSGANGHVANHMQMTGY